MTPPMQGCIKGTQLYALRCYGNTLLVLLCCLAGFAQVPKKEKALRVAEVFHNVAPSYDLMNDLMSAGMHRHWKNR